LLFTASYAYGVPSVAPAKKQEDSKPLIVRDVARETDLFEEDHDESNSPMIKAAPEDVPEELDDTGRRRTQDHHCSGCITENGQLLPGHAQTDDIGSSTDEEIYTLDALAGHSYRITVNLLTLHDSTLAIYDGNTRVAFDDDGGSGLASALTFTPPRSTAYQIRVAGYGGSTGSFTISVTAEVDPCEAGHEVHYTGNLARGEIFFSDAYANSDTCNWEITCPSSNSHILISFHNFDTESNYDFVDVKSCSRGSSGGCSHRLAHLSGTLSSSQTDWVVHSSDAVITFTSDGSVQGNGFDATFNCLSGH
jgi:hypothetical protein